MPVNTLYNYCCEKARKHLCVTDHHDMTLAVEVATNPLPPTQSQVLITHRKNPFESIMGKAEKRWRSRLFFQNAFFSSNDKPQC